MESPNAYNVETITYFMQLLHPLFFQCFEKMLMWEKKSRYNTSCLQGFQFFKGKRICKHGKRIRKKHIRILTVMVVLILFFILLRI